MKCSFCSTSTMDLSRHLKSNEMDGLNDRLEDADELEKLLGDRKAANNIIPFYSFPGSKYKRTSDEKVEIISKK